MQPASLYDDLYDHKNPINVDAYSFSDSIGSAPNSPTKKRNWSTNSASIAYSDHIIDSVHVIDILNKASGSKLTVDGDSNQHAVHRYRHQHRRANESDPFVGGDSSIMKKDDLLIEQQRIAKVERNRRNITERAGKSFYLYDRDRVASVDNGGIYNRSTSSAVRNPLVTQSSHDIGGWRTGGGRGNHYSSGDSNTGMGNYPVGHNGTGASMSLTGSILNALHLDFLMGGDTRGSVTNEPSRRFSSYDDNDDGTVIADSEMVDDHNNEKELERLAKVERNRKLISQGMFSKSNMRKRKN
jgi:hypothetical protein